MRAFPKLLAVGLLVLWLPAGTGCSLGNRFIYSGSVEVVSSPEREGLEYEEVRFGSPGGPLLHGWYVPASSPGPLLVFFHGNAANISHRVENIRFLNRLGLPVFIFDYRGYGESGGRVDGEEDIYRDARAAIACLEERGWDPGRMVFYGRSMGAAVALQMALETPPAGLVLESPFTSLREIARHLRPVTYALFGWWALGDPFDNLEKIGALSRPLLIFHGDRDRIAPPEMSRRLFERAGGPKTLVPVRGAGHSDAFEVGGEGYRRAWRTFLAALGSPAPVAGSEKGPFPLTPN